MERLTGRRRGEEGEAGVRSWSPRRASDAVRKGAARSLELQSRPWSGEDGDDAVGEGVPRSVMGTAQSATTVDDEAEAPVLAVVARRSVAERVRDDAVHGRT